MLRASLVFKLATIEFLGGLETGIRFRDSSAIAGIPLMYDAMITPMVEWLGLVV